MRILVIGGTGTIGRAIVEALHGHDVVLASRRSSPLSVDIRDEASILAMYRRAGQLDAVVCVAGDGVFAPLERLTTADFQYSLENMLMGQVNVVRLGAPFVSHHGSFTVTSGSLARAPMVGGTAISVVTGALEAFVRAAALELPRGLRVNAVSPPWIRGSLAAHGMDPSLGISAEAAARPYVDCLLGAFSGVVLMPGAQEGTGAA
jgi:NAD(P)-dependent dehydrogenase (short-subunit alcohol dehydrogenase family)